MIATLSLTEARRLALAAQGFHRKRPRQATVRHLRDTILRLGLLQIDCVNVVCPAHYMVPFSRLGPYDRSAFDKLVYRSGEFAEYWAHEISIIPAETWPLLRYRRETDRVRPWGFEKVLEERADYAAWVLEEIKRRGPLAADDLPPPEGNRRSIARGRSSTTRAAARCCFRRRERTQWERRKIWPIISGWLSGRPGRACASWWSRASCTRLGWRAGGKSRTSTRERRRREVSRRPRCFRRSTR